MHIYSILLLLSALWLSPGRAEVSWDGAGYACLVKRPNIVIHCAEGAQTLILGSGGDAVYNPVAGDVYELWQDGDMTERTTLQSIVRLPWVGR